jgi:hypothetical protein
MKKRKYILVNFLHGNSPYLRTTELALAVAEFLKEKTKGAYGVVVPLVYGDRQKAIMLENFEKTLRKNPEKILFDRTFGDLLRPLFYSGETSYEDSLNYFYDHHRETQDAVRRYIDGGLTLEDIHGKPYTLLRKDIVMEINRCPQLHSSIVPSYYTGFDYISEVLKNALSEDAINIKKFVLEKNIPLYEEIERKQALHFIAEPSIFSYGGNRPAKYQTEIFTPPNSNQGLRIEKQAALGTKTLEPQKGIYVTVTGVPGLDRLFKKVLDVGLTIYTHRPDLIPGSVKAPPLIIAHKNILFHFARSGWGSVWLSLFTKTPFITKPYTEKDDLEIYFNNICLEHLGFGRVYRGESLDELLAYEEQYRENATSIQNQLLERYGTTDGIAYTANKIVKHFVNQ